jgi:hypothetical protein
LAVFQAMASGPSSRESRGKFGHSMIETDEPEHKEYRSLIAQACAWPGGRSAAGDPWASTPVA